MTDERIAALEQRIKLLQSELDCQGVRIKALLLMTAPDFEAAQLFQDTMLLFPSVHSDIYLHQLRQALRARRRPSRWRAALRALFYAAPREHRA